MPFRRRKNLEAELNQLINSKNEFWNYFEKLSLLNQIDDLIST